VVWGAVEAMETEDTVWVLVSVGIWADGRGYSRVRDEDGMVVMLVAGSFG